MISDSGSGKKYCWKCDEELRGGAKFCAKCGHTQECPKCETPMRKSDTFCSGCGKEIEALVERRPWKGGLKRGVRGSGLKRLAIASLSIALVALLLLFVWQSPVYSWDSSIHDTDRDGTPDSNDFKRDGDGKLYFKMVYYDALCGNWFGPCDPRFNLWIDVNNDGQFQDGLDVGQVWEFWNLDKIDDPNTCCKIVANIKEDQAKVTLHAIVFDMDGSDYVDCFSGQVEGVWEVTWPFSWSEWKDQGTGGTPKCTAIWQAYGD